MASPRASSAPIKLFFDGGCQPNPGRIETAVVMRGRTIFLDDLGEGGSEDAEWLALRAALRIAQESGATHFDLIGDNAHVIAQAKGLAPCRTEAARAHKQAFDAAAAAHPPARLRWIRRGQNLAGIALARRRQAGA